MRFPKIHIKIRTFALRDGLCPEMYGFSYAHVMAQYS